MWVLPFLGCSPGPAPSPPPAGPDPLAPRRVEFVLDPGVWEEGAWTSGPVGTDHLTSPAPIAETEGDYRRAWAWVTPGAGLARVDRSGCAPSTVPYRLDQDTTVVLAYPRCRVPDALPLPGTPTRLDRVEVTRAAFGALRVLDPDEVVEAPGPDEAPATWLTLESARAWCAWQGGRLPTRAEWTAAVARAPDARVTDGTRDRWGPGPQPAPASPGWLDLRGNVAEWLADGSIAGGSWMSRPDELDLAWAPPVTRSDTIGFRCAWDPPTP